jgi:hypothetical protein
MSKTALGFFSTCRVEDVPKCYLLGFYVEVSMTWWVLRDGDKEHFPLLERSVGICGRSEICLLLSIA